MIDSIKGFDNTFYIPSTIERKNEVETIKKETQISTGNLYYDASKIGDYSQEVGCQASQKEWDRLEKSLLPTERQAKDLITNGYNVENLTKEEMSTTAYAIERGKTSTKSSQKNKSQEDEKVTQLLSKIKRLKEHQDSMYTYAMNQKGPLTINSLYKASFSGTNKTEGIRYNTQDVKKLLGQNGIEANKGNMQAANKLLGLGLEVSQQDIVKIQNIQTAVNGLDEYEETQKATDALEKGQKPGEEPLIEEEKILYIEKDIKDIVDEISKVDEEAIGSVVAEGKEVTIGNLKEAMYQNTQKVLKKDLSSNGSEVSKIAIKGKEGTQDNVMPQEIKNKAQLDQTTKDQKVEEVKAQIKEIRSRLNVEAAQKLSARMPLESTELAKVAEALRTIEEENITQVMKDVALQPTEENKALLKDVMQATHSIASHREITIEVNLSTSQEATLEECQSAIKAYADNFSVAEKRFGETTAKVESQIETFLKEKGLPQDALSIEAAKAIIASGMELTEENLRTATEVVMKLNIFLEEMTPYRAAHMIKEGLNPYEASIPAILNWAEVERLPQLKNSIAETIVALEDKHQITQEQKQNMIGLYKILSRVEQSKDDVTGYLLKNELPLTLEKLEEATKYVGKKTHVEKVIDDQFGELESLKYDKQTARQLVYESKEQNDKLVQLAKTLENMELPVTEENKDKLAKLQSILYPFIKENVKKELGKFEGLDTLPPSLTQKIDAIKNVNPELIQVMEKQNIPVTISNIYWMQKLAENPNAYGEMLSEQNLAKEGFPKSFKALEEELKDLEKKAKETKDIAIEKGDITTYRAYKQIEEMVHIQKEFSEKDGVYQIPFMIEGETKLVQMYINKENTKKNIEKEGMNVVIAYDTKNMGTITTAIHLRGDHLSYKVSTSKEEASKLLDSTKRDLQKLLSQIGYTVMKEDYSSEGVEKAVHPVHPVQRVKRGESYFEEIV